MFPADLVSIHTSIDVQSPDIAMGVDKDDPYDQGAGDQGMMFGYACNETAEYMPLAIDLAHQLTRKLADVRKSGAVQHIGPDGKSQITIEYDGDGAPVVETVVISTQHDEHITLDQLYDGIHEFVIAPVTSSCCMVDEPKIFINPTGRFHYGGPLADTGLTGRKIIVDTYGGMGRHGGGAFSGKDSTKVDRSGAYAARWIAKNLVAAAVADRIEVQLAYAIGVPEPVSVRVDTFGTCRYGWSDPESHISKMITELFDLRPRAIIDRLELFRPVFRPTSTYGHFGNRRYSWEKLDMVDKIQERL
jgi:S-adenosylmethionine synthetase